MVAAGFSIFIFESAQVINDAQNKDDYSGLRISMIMQSLESTTLALVTVLVTVSVSWVFCYFLRKMIAKKSIELGQINSLRSGFIEKMLGDLGEELTASLKEFYGEKLLN